MNGYIRTTETGWLKNRINGAIVLAFLAFSALAVRLFHLQVIDGEEYFRLSLHNCIRIQHLRPFRGLIFDRNGHLLVDNRPEFNIYVVPRDAAPLPRTLARLAEVTGIDPALLDEALRERRGGGSYKPILLRAGVDRDTVAAIEVHRYDLPGVSVEVEPRRYYVHGASASHLLGYIGEIGPGEIDQRPDGDGGLRLGDMVGKSGIEKALDEHLRGAPGGRQVEMSATGQVVRVLQTVPPAPGFNAVLTIDYRLQEKAEFLMDGLGGAVVVLEPATGDLLALVSSPAYDPNVFIGGLSQDNWERMLANPFGLLENKAIQGEYPPASTYKIITAIAGLEEGVINEKSTAYCPGYYEFGNRVFRCWRRGGHGRVDVVSALSQSCDVFFYQVGEKLGVDAMARYARACGLGRPTGIRLDREARGLAPTAAWKLARTGQPWMDGENLPIAIGQGYNLTTPLQMAVVTAAVGNGGLIPRPSLVRRFETAEGAPKAPPERPVDAAPPATLPVSEKNLALIQKGLWRVVNGPSGTARVARVEGIEVSGKTGTGQVVGRSRVEVDRSQSIPAHLMPHAWFVAYAPAEAPRIVVSVIVEHGEHGSGTAGPIARELIQYYLKEIGP